MSKTKHPILARLKDGAFRRSKSDKLIASYLERNLDQLSFETARSIADRVGVSPMTIGRYLRRLGYEGIDPLKDELRRANNPAWQIKAQVSDLQEGMREGKLLADLIRNQIDALGHVYEMTKRPEWHKAVATLVEASEVYVTSFQHIRGIAQYFASQLRVTRPNVHYLDGLDGTYAEVLDGATQGRCLFLQDFRRFARKALPLALEARNAGVKVVLLTDEFCPWAEEAADIALIIPGSQGPLWDNAVATTATIDLLISNIVVVLGDQVADRSELVTQMQDRFGDFEN
jgi:DNA-binding MurR/RpiR family transcriptional regulator